MRQPNPPRKEEVIWKGGPSKFAAPRKALTERYEATTERLKVDYGLLSRHTEEIELFRVQDLSVERSMFDRIFGVGDIVIHSGDATGGKIVLWDVPDAENVKDVIRKAARVERQRHRVGVFEENWTEGE